MASAAPQDVASAAPADPVADVLRQDASAEDYEWIGWDQTPVVSHFSGGCGLMTRPELGVVEATGNEAVLFLHNLLTQALVDPATKAELPAGCGCPSFFLNLKGRIVADPVVVRPDGERVLLVVDRRLAAMLATTLDAFRFAERVRLRDASDDWHALQLHGSGAMDLLDRAADTQVAWPARPTDSPATHHLPVASAKLAGGEAICVHDDITGHAGLTVLVPRERAAGVWQDWTTRFGQTSDGRPFGDRPLRPVGWSMFNACRVEAGRPMLGVDFLASPPPRPGPKPKDGGDEPAVKGGTLPAETGPLFDTHVSVTGGCYLGQEVVARMHARRVTAKKVVGIRMDDDALPTAGAPVEVADAQVGQVTSSTLSPILSNACLVLATLKRPHFEVGTVVSIPAEGRHAAGKVVELPFFDDAGVART